jgi:uncharacterized protein
MFWKIFAGCLFISLASHTIRADSDDPKVIDAVKRKDIRAIESLLKGHANVNAPAGDGATALHWAVNQDDINLSNLLIGSGANVNAANDLGVTPLFLACTNGSGAMVDRLLAAGAKANVMTASGESVLMECSRTGDEKAVEALLAHGADVSAKENLEQQTALMWAVSEKHPGVVKILLRHRADVQARSRVHPLLVVRVGTEIGARVVCPPGVDLVAGVPCAKVDTEPRGGSTALLLAARVGDVESARLLLAAGAKVNDTAPDGNSALVIASYSDHLDMAAFLLENGADPNWARAGYTALHTAVLRGNVELVKTLLAHGANLNCLLTKGTPVLRDNQDLRLSSDLAGATPLFLAARFLEVDILRTLIAAGANPLLGIKDGTSPLMAAAGVGSRVDFTRRENNTLGGVAPPVDDDAALEAVKLEFAKGADVNASNQDGDTALHGAAFHGYANVIQFLAGKGANLNAKNKAGKTPLDMTIVVEGNIGRHEVKSAETILRQLLAKSGAS